jgi:hypothetical protein
MGLAALHKAGLMGLFVKGQLLVLGLRGSALWAAHCTCAVRPR